MFCKERKNIIAGRWRFAKYIYIERTPMFLKGTFDRRPFLDSFNKLLLVNVISFSVITPRWPE